MFNNVVLDVFIGLIFVFLLYSLLATIFQEFIAQIIDLRARMLQKGIARMLRDDNKDKEKDPPQALWKKFYDCPSVKYLSESNGFFNKPSYISPANFSKTIIQILRGDHYDGSTRAIDEIKTTLIQAQTYNSNFPASSASAFTTLSSPQAAVPPATLPPVLIEPQTLRQLNNILVDSQQDIDRFASLLEQWFNDTMSRVSGWYKKQTQWILLGVGMGIAIAGNVDTLKIYSILARDKTAREQMVTIAVQSQQKYAAAIDEINKMQKDTTLTVEGRQVTTKTLSFTPSTGNTILDSAYRDVKSDLAQSENILGIGWNNIDSVKKYDSLQKALAKLKDSTGKGDTLSFARLRDAVIALERRERILFRAITWKSLLGWLLTALAISLGAPFWFDMLNKVTRLRAAGGRPESTSDKNDASAGKGSGPSPNPIQRKG